MASTQANSTRKAGLLPIAPAQTNTDAPKQSRTRSTAAQDGVKAKVRRLPPGLTEEEFLKILGDTWKIGRGKVSWFSYHSGHIPKSVSKDPAPAFALLQVKEDDLEELSLAVQNALWEDAKGSFNSPSLVGPPHVERSVYKKIPTGKPKKDPKEGTIDQDEEFKAFLASLAVDPTSKAETEDAPEEPVAETDSKTLITPLVAALIEKRARKAKEAAEAKSNKHSRQDSHGGKGKGSAASAEEPKKKSKEKSDKPKETVKILKKQAATAAAEAAKSVAKDIKGGASTSETGSRRAVPKGIHAILKRDLGIDKKESAKKADTVEKTKEAKGSENGTANATGSNATAANEVTATPTAPKAQAEKSSRGSRRRGKDPKSAESKPSGSSETIAAAPSPAQAAPPKAPVILQKKKDDGATSSSAKDAATTSKPSSKSANTSSANTAPPSGPKVSNPKGGQNGGSKKNSNNNPAAPSSGSTRAFLKHANQSQGITEPLLRESMEKFGSIKSIEIDRRKGFAYVEFADHNGLTKAMAASPVSIASGAVQVLERKDQAPKKAAATTNNTAQAQASVAKDSSAPAAAAAAPAAPSKTAAPASASAEKNSGEQPQQPKRSRRRGRGRGGNGGGGGVGGNSENKQGEQGGSGGAAASSTPAGGEASLGGGG